VPAVHLAYGRDGLDVDLPQGTLVIEPRHPPPVADEPAAVAAALRAPQGTHSLRQWVGRGAQVCIVHSDNTRAMPNDRVLPVLVDELLGYGVRPGDITLLCALGTHRRLSPDELVDLLGPDLVGLVRCEQHDAWNEAQLVTVSGAPGSHRTWRLNRTYVEADVRILTGFIEPHFFAGFSGGPKAAMPGIASAESIMDNHSPPMIAHPAATWGVTRGNPIWDDINEAAHSAGECFLLNVTLDERNRITGVYAGDLDTAHSAGCAACRSSAMTVVREPFDVVVTTNAGHPLDLNLYQAVKGMAAAAQVVKPGGAIVIAAACPDGLPSGSAYARLLDDAKGPDQLLSIVTAPGYAGQDQWQVQIQAQVQSRADVYVYSDGLTDEEVRRAHCTPCHDVSATVGELLARRGPDATLCALPQGPVSIPVLASAS
jgi:nickel-dependent lactate racemase